MVYVYILKTQNREAPHYVGLTDDLHSRLREHNAGQSIATKGYLPVSLIWYAAFLDRTAAATFEKYLKSGSGRAFAKRHILLT